MGEQPQLRVPSVNWTAIFGESAARYRAWRIPRGFVKYDDQRRPRSALAQKNRLLAEILKNIPFYRVFRTHMRVKMLLHIIITFVIYITRGV
jgi:hypothetical protein